jgi:hypothetical protein
LQNIAPAHAKDIVVLIDAIIIVFEEASKEGAPLSLPIASIEVGHGHSLPNLALRYMQLFSLILFRTYGLIPALCKVDGCDDFSNEKLIYTPLNLPYLAA